MPRAEAMVSGRSEAERTAVRFVWTTAGRVRRMTAPNDGERPRPASRILDSLSRFEPAPRPSYLLLTEPTAR